MVSVIYNNEDFWFTQDVIAELFAVNLQTITKHLKNICNDGVLVKGVTCSKMEQVQKEENGNVKRTL